MTIPEPPPLHFFATLCVEVAAPHDVGATPRGRRRLIPITGGQEQFAQPFP